MVPTMAGRPSSRSNLPTEAEPNRFAFCMRGLEKCKLWKVLIVHPSADDGTIKVAKCVLAEISTIRYTQAKFLTTAPFGQGFR